MTDSKDPQNKVSKFQGRLIPVDENGHLATAEDCSEDLAVHLAKNNGVTPMEQHG